MLPGIDLLDNNNEKCSLRKLLFGYKSLENLVVPIGIFGDKKKYYIDFKETSGIFIGGETGSGKSMFLDALIVSLLIKNTSDNLKFLLIDMNRVELNDYVGIPHLIGGIISDSREALNSIINVMEERRNLLINSDHKDIFSYNEKNKNKLEQIIIVIDEGIDVIRDEYGKKVLTKLLLDGRSLGIHLIFATNSYLKGNFEKNFIDMFTYVMSFDMASKEQADFIKLDDANLLMVMDEALVRVKDKVSKIQTPLVSDEEVNRVIKYIKNNS